MTAGRRSAGENTGAQNQNMRTVRKTGAKKRPEQHRTDRKKGQERTKKGKMKQDRKVQRRQFFTGSLSAALKIC